jgi:hypothetical protein
MNIQEVTFDSCVGVIFEICVVPIDQHTEGRVSVGSVVKFGGETMSGGSYVVLIEDESCANAAFVHIEANNEFELSRRGRSSIVNEGRARRSEEGEGEESQQDKEELTHGER